LIRYEGHVTKEHAKDAEIEIAVHPNARIDERVRVNVFPDCERKDKN
jgi:hypothetical protein